MKKAKEIILVFILGVLTVLLGLYVESNLIEELPLLILYVVIGGLLIFFGQDVAVYLWAFIRKIRPPFVYQKMHTTLEYLDEEGKKVSQQMELNIAQLSRWIKQTELSLFTEVGSIISENGNGVNASIIEREEQRIKYHIDFSDRGVYRKPYLFRCSNIFEGVFDHKELEYWTIPLNHRCNIYTFTVLYPFPKSQVRFKLFKEITLSDKTKTWKEIHDTDKDEVTFIRNGYRVSEIYIQKIKKGEVYKISWDIDLVK